MTALENIRESAYQPAANTYLTRIGMEPLADFAERRNRLTDALDELADIGDEVTSKVAARLSAQLDTFEPSITMIGQVKAGKTSLVNAMTGMPDLLPADVNPWTSVITSLHLSAAGFPDQTRARFRFFSEDDWQRLFSRGGRIGELAARAGAEDEVAKVQRQLTEMREKSRNRLGRRFELLLGQEHDYGYFDRALIERYVVLGDEFEGDTAITRDQGRFADITQSADLFIDRPDLPVGLCVRDTPGVNDTFMIREQITIRAIRESRLCVVVLSAHQALSNVDLALIRLISNVKSREVVIFVNRIDELSDPAKQVPEIEASIRDTLQRHQGPTEAQIVFGSAYWAGRALTGSLKGMAKSSADALLNWVAANPRARKLAASPEGLIWEMSGVPALMRALSERIVEGEGAEAMSRAAAQAQNLVRTMRAAVVGGGEEGSGPVSRLSVEELDERIEAIASTGLDELARRFVDIEAEFEKRLDRAHKSFLERATAALIGHLEVHGDKKVWEYDPSGLRMLLRTAYTVFAANTARQVQGAFDGVAGDLANLYRDCFDTVGEDFRVDPPQAPRVPPPVQIGQTIALDMKGSWWRRWWQRRRGYEKYAADFSAMISAETKPIVDDLGHGLALALGEESAGLLREFLQTQKTLMLNLAGGDADTSAESAAKAETLDRIHDTVTSYLD